MDIGLYLSVWSQCYVCMSLFSLYCCRLFPLSMFFPFLTFLFLFFRSISYRVVFFLLGLLFPPPSLFFIICSLIFSYFLILFPPPLVFSPFLFFCLKSVCLFLSVLVHLFSPLPSPFSYLPFLTTSPVPLPSFLPSSVSIFVRLLFFSVHYFNLARTFIISSSLTSYLPLLTTSYVLPSHHILPHNLSPYLVLFLLSITVVPLQPLLFFLLVSFLIVPHKLHLHHSPSSHAEE